MAEEDLYVQVTNTAGEAVFAVDFRNLVPELTQYAERFGLTLRQAAEAAVNNFCENAAIDPAEAIALLESDPWLFRFSMEDGSRVKVQLSDYAEAIMDLARAAGCTHTKAAKAVLFANLDDLRPRLRWIEADEAK
jgi:hypothetical protein